MTKLYLHIGTEKTGSTTIQDTLYKNRSILLEKNILYPESFGRPNHVELAVIGQGPNKSSELNAVVGLSNSEKEWDGFTYNAISKLKSEVKNTNPSVVIMSNEHLHSRITTEDEIIRLKNIFDSLFDEVVIICYLREQLDLAISHYSTMIKSGGTSDLILPIRSRLPHYFDFNGMLNKWNKYFPTIICREYSRLTLKNGDVLSDFLSVLDIETKLGMIKEKNLSLGAEELNFLKMINKHLPLVRDGVLNNDRHGLVSIFEKVSSSNPLTVQADVADKFRSLYVEGNSLIEQKYFEGRPLFENKKMLTTVGYQNLEESFSRVFRDVWIEIKRQLNEKDRKIEELQNKLKKNKVES